MLRLLWDIQQGRRRRKWQGVAELYMHVDASWLHDDWSDAVDLEEDATICPV